jgi:hypothetical protein
MSGACNTDLGSGKCLQNFRRNLRGRGADETEIRLGGVDWIHWVQDEVQYWAFMSM